MTGFDDLLDANANFAKNFTLHGFDGVARAGVAMVTCMDSRIDPLAMIGLSAGDAKILRNPGGRVTPSTLVALVLGTNLLGVNRIMIVQHTRCAVATKSEREIKAEIGANMQQDATWLSVSAITDPMATLQEDVQKVTSHPLIAKTVKVGGFVYDVDTGLVEEYV